MTIMLIIGFILLALELTTGTFYLFGLGVAFLLSAMVGFLPLWTLNMVNNLEWWALGVTAPVSLYICHSIKKASNKSSAKAQKILDGELSAIGENVHVVMLTNDTFRVGYRGTSWEGQLIGANVADLKLGQVLVVDAQVGNVLHCKM